LSEATFGERLAEARRIKGETIEEVSEQLRIRPSIILAVETSNFSHMPHKGYTRNMVSSYARYLGLDPSRITEQFLREFRRWESLSQRGTGSNASSLNLPSQRFPNLVDQRAEPGRDDSNRETITAAERNKDRSSVWGRDNRGETNKEFREQLQQAQDDKDTRQRVVAKRPPVRRVEQPTPTRPHKQVRTNDYVGRPPRRSLLAGVASGLFSRPLVRVVGLVVAFLAVLLLWAVLASNCSSNEVTNVPVTGVSSTDEGLSLDQTSNNAESIQEQIAEDNRYGPFELMVEVVSGASWLQIDVDGTTPVGEVCQAPWSSTFTVTATSRVEAGAPANVRVFRNGIEVALENEDGLGVLELEVEQRPIVQNAQNADAASQR